MPGLGAMGVAATGAMGWTCVVELTDCGVGGRGIVELLAT
jgi:hypothetical protein